VKQRSLLALLLLGRGAVVSSDRLIDELWGDDPPEDAATALQQHVSRLRKLLEPHDVLETRSPGYVLALGPEALDLARFERLRREGRRLLAEGRAGDAARVLRSALDLWRGQPLADLAGEHFLLGALPRLEEARLEALEARVEADLAAGRHAELVAELRELPRAHPLRERLRAQLMLALYRAGRQAEALDVYADARRTLVEQLGLEPGPELQRLQQAILAHDSALDAPRGWIPAGRRPRALAVAGAFVLVLLVAALAAAALLWRDGERDPAVLAARGEGAVVALDAATGSLRRRLSTGRTPSAIAVHDGVVWVVDADAQTVLRLSEASRVVETFSTGATPTDVAAGAGVIWVANGRPLGRAQFVGPVATAVARLDATTGTERGDTRLPRPGASLSNLVENHLAVKSGAAWAVTPDFAVVRIEAATGEITASSSAIRAAAVAAGPAGVWVLGDDGAVAKLDERTARPIVRTSVPTSPPGSIAVGEDAAWVTSPADGTLWRIGAGPRPTPGAIDLARGVSDLTVGAGAVWVANPLAGTVVQVGIESAAIERTIDLGGIPRSVALDGDTLWVAAVADPTASTIEVAGVRPFPASTCERVLAGKGTSDLLVVSDLPLQGGDRLKTTQMTHAIAFVLRERGFLAGRFRVAYQSCDDSVARTGIFDEPKCAANARAYAQNPDVVAVIGTFNSGCAVAALPELNRAPGGPLAMVSPANSVVGLTRGGPGVDPSLPGALYPTGRRNYLRVYPTDDLQGAALALLARDRGRRRVYVLDDGDPGYGVLIATSFETAARRLGLTVVGRDTWDPEAESYTDLVRRIARSRAEAVFIGGLLDTNAARVVRDLRARLGTSVDLLAPDGLKNPGGATSLTLLRSQAGQAALGVYVSLVGAVTERLPPAGTRFARRFGKTQAGVAIQPVAVYAAQATEVLLDAIARSDGTRASVLEELFATRVRGGLLGSFAFDANGDITESPVTILRVARGGGPSRTDGIEGGVVDRVVRPSPRLVASED
jgi:branched-chain amino acid transport system substrate-binding protein